jgi:ATP-dependent RNA helicase SUPV3L1/SUV3
LLAERATQLVAGIDAGTAGLTLERGIIGRQVEDGPSEVLARLKPGKGLLTPQLQLEAALEAIPPTERRTLRDALEAWLTGWLGAAAPLAALDAASREPEGGPELRALLIRLVDAGGVIARDGSGLDALQPPQREALRKLGVRVGALDLFVPAALKPGPLGVWRELAQLRGLRTGEVLPEMPPVVTLTKGRPALGYRRLGNQAIRIDMAEKLLREAHGRRATGPKGLFTVDPALARSMGLALEGHVQLLRQAGFLAYSPQALPEGAFGPPAPPSRRSPGWFVPSGRIDAPRQAPVVPAVHQDPPARPGACRTRPHPAQRPPGGTQRAGRAGGRRAGAAAAHRGSRDRASRPPFAARTGQRGASLLPCA